LENHDVDLSGNDTVGHRIDPFMSLTPGHQLATLSDLLAARREAILVAWRKMDRADPEQMTGRSLTLGQFLDHIPAILDAYELKLRSRPGGADARAADVEKKGRRGKARLASLAAGLPVEGTHE